MFPKIKCRNLSGIYCIENIENGKKYIGSSINMAARIASHRSLLRRDRHDNPYLQKSFNKNKECNFKVCVIEIVTDKTKSELESLESYYIKLYNTLNAKCGYNLKDPIEGFKNYKKPKSTRDKISKALKGRPMSANTRAALIKANKEREYNFTPEQIAMYRESIKKCHKASEKIINQYSLEGEFIKQYSSIKEASKYSNVPAGAISGCARHKKHRAGNFVWRFEGDKFSYVKRVNMRLFMLKDLQGNILLISDITNDFTDKFNIHRDRVGPISSSKSQITKGKYHITDITNHIDKDEFLKKYNKL